LADLRIARIECLILGHLQPHAVRRPLALTHMDLILSRKIGWSWLALLAGLGGLAWLLAPVMAPFLAGVVLAYALHPVVELLARRRVPRWLGAVLVLAAMGMVFFAVLLMVVPVVTKQLPLIRDQLPWVLDQVNQYLVPMGERFGLDVGVDVAAVREVLKTAIAGHEGELFGGVWASLRIGGSAVLAVLGNIFLMPMVAFYLLLDWSSLLARTRQLVPLRWQLALDGFARECDQVLGQYLRGQLLVMGILALVYSVLLALVGLKLAIPIGLFTGLAVFVPYVGFGLGLLLALMAAVLQFQALSGVAWVGGVFLLGQLLESLYLTPRLLGERIGLHPLAVIFALLAFGHLFGFVGILIALPVSAVLLVVIRRALAAYLVSPLYLK
jgi:predicted PurR-regulated permease PerM